jgi:hypothetical protein
VIRRHLTPLDRLTCRTAFAPLLSKLTLVRKRACKSATGTGPDRFARQPIDASRWGEAVLVARFTSGVAADTVGIGIKSDAQPRGSRPPTGLVHGGAGDAAPMGQGEDQEVTDDEQQHG